MAFASSVLPIRSPTPSDALRRQLKVQVTQAFMDAYPELLWMHAAAMARNGEAVLIAGPWASGKSTTAASLARRGWQFLADDLVPLILPEVSALAFPLEPTVRRSPSGDRLSEDEVYRLARSSIPVTTPIGRRAPITAVCFPHFDPSRTRAVAVSPGEALLAMLQSAVNLGDHEEAALTALGGLLARARIFALRYRDGAEAAARIEETLFHQAAIDSGPHPLLQQARRFTVTADDGEANPTGAPSAGDASTAPAALATSGPPQPTPWDGVTRKLTVGMATYDDFDGVYFTVQAIRLYHPEVASQIEILVLDNHPENGEVARALASLASWVPGYRYLPNTEIRGTAARDLVFREARSPYVMCVDSHVLIAPGGLAKLVDYFDRHPDGADLLQGPMCYDDLRNLSTHMDPVWRDGMYGTWGTDARGADENGEPFEIEMQGLGLFACRREAWLGFNPRFRGFGGEEGYIHEKFRRAGARTLCLPFLRWMHRFSRPRGTGYRNVWADRIRNYAIALDELGLDAGPMEEHFAERVGEEAGSVLREVRAELASPFHYFDAIYCINLDGATERWEAMQARFESLGIGHRVERISAVATPESHHIGCALTHRQIIARARRRGLKSVLVFEDDAIFLDAALEHLGRSVAELATQPWELFYLGGHKWGRKFASRPGCRFLEDPEESLTCTHAIAYHERSYDRILRDVPDDVDGVRAWLEVHHGIDQYLRWSPGRYLASPVVASQPTLLSQEEPELRGRFTLGKRDHRYSDDYYAYADSAAHAAAEVVVPMVLDLCPLASVVDVGCGTGAWLSAFENRGVADLLGLDGDHFPRHRLRIAGNFFRAMDLEQPIVLDRRFDLAISLEVAEHLPRSRADGFVDDLTRLAPLVLFSAAIPGQGGENHLNEQWPSYWADRFARRGFAVIDILRWRVFSDPRVAPFYAQNLLLFASDEAIRRSQTLRRLSAAAPALPDHIVHPAHYEAVEGHRRRTGSPHEYADRPLLTKPNPPPFAGELGAGQRT